MMRLYAIMDLQICFQQEGIDMRIRIKELRKARKRKDEIFKDRAKAELLKTGVKKK